VRNAALCFAVALAVSGCAFNPVVTPFAFQGAQTVPAEKTATVWGIADGTQMYFREINGKGLPSRGGGGYPISLSLLPGTYDVEVYFLNYDSRYTITQMKMVVEAGHTYAVEHILSPGNTHVALRLKDLGTETVCRFDRYNEVRGNAKLACSEQGGT